MIREWQQTIGAFHARNFFERMILNRLLDYVTGLEECIPDTQFGFLRGKGTTDALAISRRITELSRNAQNGNLFKCYIDLTKAYDKVDRSILWKVLRRYGVPEVLISVIKNFHDGARARVRVDGILSEVFELNTGVKQGSVLSPTLFNIFLGAIVHAARREFKEASLGVPLKFSMSDSLLGERTQNHPFLSYTITDILFADDMELLARAADALNVMLQILNRITASFGQLISSEKSKVMVISSSSFDKPKIILNGCELEVVDNFKYLGSIEESNGDITEELARRRQAMGLAFHSLILT